MSRINAPLEQLKSPAVAGNVEVFSDPGNLQAIRRYLEQGFVFSLGVNADPACEELQSESDSC